ncbi:MAG: Hsp20/alpha crystallin family protein [Verrucomicrobia bacterium]|nr:Hsp20/alpha crystallin family protein [Verrucomicrobiota bacterium]
MSLFTSIIPSLNRTPSVASEGSAAPTKPALKPAYEVQETPEAYRLTVYLPGVTRDALELTIETDGIRIAGRRTWTRPAGWTALHRETADVGYELVLTHDNAIDADKVAAELRDGVLQVTLPKHEALKPRKITVA